MLRSWGCVMSESLMGRSGNITRLCRVIRGQWKTVVFVMSFVTMLAIIFTLFFFTTNLSM